MKPEPAVVTLSDSLTSPAPRRKPTGKGTPKVVCIDSDTESDGSYTHPVADNLYSKASTCSNFTESRGTNAKDSASNFVVATDAHLNTEEEWPSLQRCSNDRKPWSPSLSLSFEKESKVYATDVNAVDKPDDIFGMGKLDSGLGRDASLKHQAYQKTTFLLDDPTSPQSVSSFERKVNCRVDGKSSCQSKDALNIESTSHIKFSDRYDSCSTSTVSLSPSHEVKISNPAGAKYLGNDQDAGPTVSTSGRTEASNSLSRPVNNLKNVGTSITNNTCLSLLSDDSDDFLAVPKWDDHLKGIIGTVGSSKGADIHVSNIHEQLFDHRIKTSYTDSDDSYGGHSLSKRKYGKFGTDNSHVADLSDSGDSRNSKKLKNYNRMDFGDFRSSKVDDDLMDSLDNKVQENKDKEGHAKGRNRKQVSKEQFEYDSDSYKQEGEVTLGRKTAFSVINDSKILDKETEKPEKVPKRVINKEAREAEKKLSKEERENLKREKQEEKKRQQEARKIRNEEEKKRKEQLKAEAVERRKFEKEKGKWEKGKFALQNITAFVDTKILEGGLIGGHLLTRFAEKGFNYQLVQNPVSRTVIWQMKVPSNESTADSQSQDYNGSQKNSAPQLSLKNEAISYVLVVLEAEQFLDMITQDNLDKHIKKLQTLYPSFTLCYLINKLMRFLHKREQEQYKKPDKNWTRPPVEQVLARLVTAYDGVRSRICLDEAEVADHIIGLTRSLAECPFKRKLSPLSLSANGDHVVKNDSNSDVIKKNLWLKALVALPKVSGACAVAIAKKYPSMTSLFEAYLDPSKTVHEKEYLLQDLVKEGLLGGESNRRIGPACSKRVYRIFMAQQGNLHTDDVEEGADLFRE